MAKKAKKKAAPKSKERNKSTPKGAAINLIDPAVANTFRADQDSLTAAKERLKTAQKAVAKVKKTIKEHGFTVRQVEVAMTLDTPEGEQAMRMSMAKDLEAAAMVGAAIGQQLSLFLSDPKVLTRDRAIFEGRKDAAANKPMKPVYAPGTEGYDAYVEAYQAVQGEQITKGITKLDKAAEAAAPKGSTAKSKAADKAKGDAGPPRPAIGKATTRATAKEPDAASVKRTADKYITEPSTPKQGGGSFDA